MDVLEQLRRNKGDVNGALKQIITKPNAKFADIKPLLDAVEADTTSAKVLSNAAHLTKYLHLVNAIAEHQHHCEHMSCENWSVVVQFLLRAYESFSDGERRIESVKANSEIFRALSSLLVYQELVNREYLGDILSICRDFLGLHEGRETSCHPYIMKCLRILTQMHVSDAHLLGQSLIELGRPRSPLLVAEMQAFSCMVPQPLELLIELSPQLVIHSDEIEFESSTEFDLMFFRPSCEADISKFIAVRALSLATTGRDGGITQESSAKRQKMSWHSSKIDFMFRAFRPQATVDADGIIEWLRGSITTHDPYIFWALVFLGQNIKTVSKELQLEAWKVATAYIQDPSCSSGACFCIAQCISHLTKPDSIDSEVLASIKSLLLSMTASSHPVLTSGSLILYWCLKSIVLLDDAFQKLKIRSLEAWLRDRVANSRPQLLTQLMSSECRPVYLQQEEAEVLRSVVEYHKKSQALHYLRPQYMEATADDTCSNIMFPTGIATGSHLNPVRLTDYLWMIAISAAVDAAELPIPSYKVDAFTSEDLRAFLWFATLASFCQWGDRYCEAALSLAKWEIPAADSWVVSSALISLQDRSFVTRAALLGDKAVPRHSKPDSSELRSLQPFLQSYNHQRSTTFLCNIAALLNKAEFVASNEANQLFGFLVATSKKQSPFSRLRAAVSQCKIMNAILFVEFMQQTDDWLSLSMIPDNRKLLGLPPYLSKELLDSFTDNEMREFGGIILVLKRIISTCDFLPEMSTSMNARAVVDNLSNALQGDEGQQFNNTNSLPLLITVPLYLKHRNEYERLLLDFGIPRGPLERSRKFLTEFSQLQIGTESRRLAGVVENMMKECSQMSSDEEKLYCISRCYSFLQGSCDVIPQDVICSFFDNLCALVACGDQIKTLEEELSPLIKTASQGYREAVALCRIATALWTSGLSDSAFVILAQAEHTPLTSAFKSLPKLNLEKVYDAARQVLELKNTQSTYEMWNMILQYAVLSVDNMSVDSAFQLTLKVADTVIAQLIRWTDILDLQNHDPWMSVIGRIIATKNKAKLTTQNLPVHETDQTKDEFHGSLVSVYSDLPYYKKWSLNPYFQRDGLLNNEITPRDVFGEASWEYEVKYRPFFSTIASEADHELARLANNLLDAALRDLGLPSMGLHIVEEVPEILEQVLPNAIALRQKKVKEVENHSSEVEKALNQLAESTSNTAKKLLLNVISSCFKQECKIPIELEYIVKACQDAGEDKYVHLGILSVELIWNKAPTKPLLPEIESSLQFFYSKLDDKAYLMGLPPKSHGICSSDPLEISDIWQELNIGLIQNEVFGAEAGNLLERDLQSVGLWGIANEIAKKPDVYNFEKTWWLQQWDTVEVPPVTPDLKSVFKGLQYGCLIGYFTGKYSEDDTFASLAKLGDNSMAASFEKIISPFAAPHVSQVTRFGREILLRKKNDLLGLALELRKYCKYLRNEGDIHRSVEYALKLEQLASSKTPSAAISSDIESLSLVESAETNWVLGRQRMAITSMKHLLENLTARSYSPYDGAIYPTPESASLLETHLDVAQVYCTLGAWSRSSRNEPDSVIMKSYFEKAEAFINTDNAAAVHHSYAKFCDEALHESDIEESISLAQQACANTQKQLDYLTQLLIGECASRKVQYKYQQAKKLLDSQTQNLNEQLEHQSQLTIRCIENYLLGSLSGDLFEGDMARFIALWLANTNNDAVNTVVRNILCDVPIATTRRSSSRSKEIPTLVKPVFKFLPWMNQLSSRLDTLEQSDNKFQAVLQSIVFQACIDHPHHVLWQLINIVKASNTNNGRKTAAKTIIRRAQKPNTIPILEMMAFGEKIAELGAVRLESKQRLVTFKELGSRIAKWWLETLPEMKLPVPTSTVVPRPDCDYRNVPTISTVGREVVIAGGISAPKIVKMLNSHGETHRMVLKGNTNDDLRQDAIMQQVFSLASDLLKVSKTTRNLRVRTYNVVPHGANSGAIEFVRHTRSLQEILEPLHEKYGGTNEYPLRKARQTIGQKRDLPKAQRVRVYEDVMRHTPPQMRHFWPQRFPDPLEWFQAKTAWTRSCAVMSIVGYIVGLGDRHCSNLLVDTTTGEVVHIDLGVAFDQGKLLVVPETVPFRLTRDMVDGMGVCGTAGVFTLAAESTLQTMRDQRNRIITILEVLKHDTLYTWRLPRVKLRTVQLGEGNDDNQESPQIEGSQASHALGGVKQKLTANLSCEAEVRDLVAQARDPANLALLYHGWTAFY